MKAIFLIGLTLLVTSCASTIQSASVLEAYKKFESQEYNRTLELITRAENSKNTPPEMKAELTYLKAQTYEQLGQQKVAKTLYEYIVEEHGDSQYAYLATDKLSAN